ncbi:Sodium-dependent dicarboxylate transporter SdcS [Tsuneonella dongtanensis]|uniref:Sodium-dependent dicarboxylate transporter SdcS n=1 Tax=Tsuneonella dongtanensis TaxID=692370 RepID=A0A1B2ADG4_9SPHN|nr:DASS family sodium-coupled anion symporter [Tsuneonella dongtanensis]ANY20202.1 Sodium-dependent dicarboxylate transporter SdcS [Tsuneonella dongtanensis]
MTARRIGLVAGLVLFLLTVVLPPPDGMSREAWTAAGLVMWMAAWWMTEAIPLYATALLPFIVLPLGGVADANKTAAAYYSPIIFIFIGGAFLALAIERTGLHRRLALWIMGMTGAKSWQLLLGVMAATAILSMMISNTSSALIMMPMAVAMLAAGGVEPGETDGFAGALPMGIAFAASIGGLGTLIGTPTNVIGVGLIEQALGVKISFLQWSLYALPLVALAIPLAAFLIAKVQRIGSSPFDPVAARASIADGGGAWSVPEKRLMVVVVLAMLAWVTQPWTEPLLPKGGLTDGTIAAAAGLAMFLLPDGTGRPMLTWPEANRAPWDVVLMFGGGLAMAMGMTASGLAEWLGQALLPLASLPPFLLVLVVVAFIIVITEFASNIATASGIMPVVAALAPSMHADPILIALPAAIAATWGFMLPAGTGPNALAWATGHLSLKRMIAAGFWLDVAGAILIASVIWAMHGLLGYG